MQKEDIQSNISKQHDVSIFTDFVHSCINNICNLPQTDCEVFLKMGWTIDEYQQNCDLMYSLLQNPAVLSVDKNNMPKEFFQYPDNIQDVILFCLKARNSQLSTALLKQVSKLQSPIMIDFDWKLKKVLGSSKVSTLTDLLVELDLEIEENDSRKNLRIEMNEQELDSFIKVLKSI